RPYTTLFRSVFAGDEGLHRLTIVILVVPPAVVHCFRGLDFITPRQVGNGSPSLARCQRRRYPVIAPAIIPVSGLNLVITALHNPPSHCLKIQYSGGCRAAWQGKRGRPYGRRRGLGRPASSPVAGPCCR